jgi:hypothetical protein
MLINGVLLYGYGGCRLEGRTYYDVFSGGDAALNPS